jgi:hypothetical protein
LRAPTRRLDHEFDAVQNKLCSTRFADGHAYKAKGEINAIQLQSRSLQASSLLPLRMLNGSS